MFSFRQLSPNKNTKTPEKPQNAKSASLGEQDGLREDYICSTKAIKAMRPLPLCWVEYLEAQIPTYDTIMRGEEVQIDKLTHLRGMKEAATILRNAFDIQQDRR